MSGFSFKAASNQKIVNAFSKGLFAAREQILTDCNYFVRQDHGTLRDSGRTDLRGTTLVVTYSTPYASRVYYTGHPSTNVNPNASLQWCQKAADTDGDQWREIIEKGMSNSL